MTETWSSLAHDLTDAASGAAGIIDMKAYEAALDGPAFRRALLGFVVYQGVFLVFNR